MRYSHRVERGVVFLWYEEGRYWQTTGSNVRVIVKPPTSKSSSAWWVKLADMLAHKGSLIMSIGHGEEGKEAAEEAAFTLAATMSRKAPSWIPETVH